MDFGNIDAPPYVAAGRSDINAPYKKPELDERQVSSEETEEPTLIEEIREKGFTQFLKELEEKKMEELRKKILADMGLTEEDLENMPGDQRAEIEKMIAREITERIAANAEMNGSTSAVLFQKTNIEVEMTEVRASAMIAFNMGMGPLLALQEAEAAKAESGLNKDPDEEGLTG